MHSPDPLRHSFAALLGEQFRAVGLAMFREMLFAGLALAFICIFSVVMALRYTEQLNFAPELLQPALLIALLLPFAVWKGDKVFGRAFLWTLPVRRQRAAVAKVLAGGIWLMLAMLAAFVMMAAVALLTAGSFGVEEVRLVGASVAGAARVEWTTPLWMWVMPFTAATILYLFSSALLLGVRHPVWWVFGSVIGTIMFTATIATVGPDGAFEHGIEPIRAAIWSGKAGLDFVLTGGNELARQVDRPGPGSDTLWSALPDMSRWAWATAAWLGLALLAMALAIRRHWER